MHIFDNAVVRMNGCTMSGADTAIAAEVYMTGKKNYKKNHV
jgi:hypothetical protein